MARLIDADALEKHIADTFGYPAADILHEIATFPTVDAVPVVRCKDYKHAYLTYDGEVKYCEIFDKEEAVYLPPSFFCAYGERKDND